VVDTVEMPSPHPGDADPNHSLSLVCISCNELLESDETPGSCSDCRLRDDIATLQSRHRESKNSRRKESLTSPAASRLLSSEKATFAAPPVSYVAIPYAADGYEDDTSSILPGGSAQSSKTRNHKPSALVSASTSSAPVSSDYAKSSNDFLASVIGGERPLLGMGGGIRRIGLDFISNWGLTDCLSISVLTNLSRSELEAKNIRAQLPKNLFILGSESVSYMKDRLSSILETQSLFRDRFTSSTMPNYFPVFLSATKALKKAFIELIRLNIRESVCDSARRLCRFVDYIPTTSIDNRKDLLIEFESRRPNLGSYFHIVYSNFETNWSSNHSNNMNRLSNLAMDALNIEYTLSDKHNLKAGCFKGLAGSVYQAEGQWLRRMKPQFDANVSLLFFKST
jgi:hypothetical protein